MAKQGYLDREAESVGERNRPKTPETEAQRALRLSTPQERARESRGMRKAMSETGEGDYGFNK